LSIFYALMAACLFVPVVAGLYTRRPAVPEALAACGAGVLTLIAARLAGMVGIPQLSLIGIVASGAGFGVVYAVRRQMASS
jgi:hypothetical protein